MAGPSILDTARQRILVFDGAMGTAIQARDLPLSDYEGHENCVDVITLTRPDVVREIHRSFLAVGCDAVSTNTFGANKIVLSEFGIAERTYEINRRAAEIAREVVEENRAADHERPAGAPATSSEIPWGPAGPHNDAGRPPFRLK